MTKFIEATIDTAHEKRLLVNIESVHSIADQGAVGPEPLASIVYGQGQSATVTHKALTAAGLPTPPLRRKHQL